VIRRELLKTGLVATGLALSGGGLRMAFASPIDSSPGWWRGKAIRWLQTNLRETDAAIDPKNYVDEIEVLHVNTALVNAGGITAYYPTEIEFAHVSEYLPAGRDLFGEILKEAHSRGIHVVSRWDFSKARKDVYDAHPEWFFKMADGGPPIYNGLYQVCINGGWIQDKALEILGEALDRYAVDGCFFNNFLNPETDYAGRSLGICHCDNCQRLYQERYGRPVPEKADADYRQFMQECGRTTSEKIIGLLRTKRPSAALVGGTPSLTDIVYGESSTGIDRPLPLWPYTASDNVNKWANSYPDAGVMCQSMQFLDFPWRYSSVPRAEIASRIWQSVANGGFAAMSLNGTVGSLMNRSAVATAEPIYRWLKEHEEYYHNQVNEARVVLLATAQGGQSGAGFEGSTEAYRGMFRLLSEQHIPFASMTHLDWLGRRSADLVITTGPIPGALQDFVRQGGNLLVASTFTPEFEIVPIAKRWEDLDGAYAAVHDKSLFASLKDIDVAMMDGDFLELRAPGKNALTFVPPTLYAPPEFVGAGWKDSGKPAMVLKQLGRGTVAWIPWDIAGLYYRYSLESHQGILANLVDRLLPSGRDIRTSAHPLVQMTLLRQRNRRILHLTNLSGHSDTAYFEPLPMASISISIRGDFSTIQAARAGKSLAATRNRGFTSFELPRLDDYEVLVLT
jgi:hypothetical protein